ncbi:MauE/DoxX family redox-associated membrane protein [Paraflavitalea speifideaquila]|uniref:MauE/DoxX family redox-associated membrane protein n=1 Tax=Paraflavitalea speifideaquila TaxID=3076558 RepID=UPI0028E601E4|nr:MauE/DoxX family redox-associated membrane protein [Paraflavitalea speifideiaquila]
MKRTTIVETVVFLFVVLFLYTGISKIMEYTVFKEQLKESPILGFAANFVARWLPIMEFLLVVLLIVPRWRLKGLYLSTALMTAFTVYIIVLMSISTDLPCSCGGVLAQLSWGSTSFLTAYTLPWV